MKAAGKRLQMFARSFGVNEWIVTVVVSRRREKKKAIFKKSQDFSQQI